MEMYHSIVETVVAVWVFQDYAKRAKSLAHDVLWSTDPSPSMEAYVSLDWSEGSTPNSCRACSSSISSSTEHVSFPETTASTQLAAPGMGTNTADPSAVRPKCWMENCRGLIKKVVLATNADNGRVTAWRWWNVSRRASIVCFCVVFFLYVVSGLVSVQNTAR